MLEAVYFVETSDFEKFPVNPLAIRPVFEEALAWWEDTSRGRSAPISQFLEGQEALAGGTIPSKIVIDVGDGVQVTLQRLTLQLYNAHVKEGVIDSPEFRSDQELTQYYLQTEFWRG